MITSRRNRGGRSQGSLVVNEIDIVKTEQKRTFKFNVILMCSILLSINPRVQEPAKFYRVLRFRTENRK